MSFLTSSTYIHHAFLEITSQCNLRCVYCAVSLPKYKGKDLNLSYLDSVIETLKKRGTRFLNVNGHGETTMVADWHKVCDRLIEEGFQLVIITNLARRLSEEEIRTLSRFYMITASIDTVDPELFTRLRRSAKLDVFFENMNRIQQAVEKENHELYWNWSAVVTNQNVFGLKKLVEEGLKRGVRRFTFSSLKKYEDIETDLDIQPIQKLEATRFFQAEQYLRETEKMVLEKGGMMTIQPELLSFSKTNLEDDESINLKPLKSSDKQTRECYLPWMTFFLRASGEVAPCCWYEGLGKMSLENSLEKILKNNEFNALKKSLIQGNLSPTCQKCPQQPYMQVSTFKKKLFFLMIRFRWHLFCVKYLKFLYPNGLKIPMDYNFTQ